MSLSGTVYLKKGFVKADRLFTFDGTTRGMSEEEEIDVSLVHKFSGGGYKTENGRR